jgi:hypothetical protein
MFDSHSVIMRCGKHEYFIGTCRSYVFDNIRRYFIYLLFLCSELLITRLDLIFDIFKMKFSPCIIHI